MTTPYRNEIDALRQRKEGLEQELASIRAQTSALDGLRQREAELAGELASIAARLDGAAAKRALPMLDRIAVASPCHQSWDEMLGDDRVRFCLACDKNVFNLSAMTREDAEALLGQKAGGEVCVRYYQRADGTILTQDCPVGAKRKRRKKLALAVAGAGAMAFGAAASMMKTSCPPRVGAVAVQGEALPPPEERPVPSVMGTVSPPAPPPTVAPPPTTHRMGAVAPLPHPGRKMGKMVLGTPAPSND